MTDPTPAYIEQRTAQVNRALRAQNAAAAMVVVDQIAVDGHPDLARAIRNDLGVQAATLLARRFLLRSTPPLSA